MSRQYFFCLFGAVAGSTVTLLVTLLQLHDSKVACKDSRLDSVKDSASLSASSTHAASYLRCMNSQLTLPLSKRSKSLKRIRWLHLPKTGTSFMATLWNYGCGQIGFPLDIRVDQKAWYDCPSCYDIALRERFPWRDYCDGEVILEKGCSDGCGHEPFRPRDQGKSVVAFFRKPSQRLLSAYHDLLHSVGFGRFEYKILKQTSSLGGAAAYVRFPGIAGCTARMLTGADCADPSPVRSNATFDGGKSVLESALLALEKLEFVGLTERWDESICLFHRMFGGRIHPGEFKNFHSTDQKKKPKPVYDEQPLHGFKDAVDERIYEAAVQRFERDLKQHVPSQESVCADIKHKMQLYAELQSNCSCEAMSRQCGVDRLTGIDCGECPKGRLTYLRTWGTPRMTWNQIAEFGLHAQCEQGKCFVKSRTRQDGRKEFWDVERTPDISKHLYQWKFNHSLLLYEAGDFTPPIRAR